ncbi:hypothetical protein IscW_ISCW013036 [Ixodes scapularis]|uniref:Uncharacterized protein n=1 Tax=Ixodes scapularis TaxID=6945 RepID=B7QAP6_IXOSC|nr:hypothetical protein IscW_ISCW013036 [Ixodes scapularis]|eukprot:XP_002412622.1 hypothetical protein IscW_ISCW013036 [Ixodes scapularis]
MEPQAPSVKEVIEDDLVAKKDSAAVTGQRDNTKGKKQMKEEPEKDGKCFPQVREKLKETNAEEDEQTPDSEIKRWRRSMQTRQQSDNENYRKPRQKTAVEMGGCGKRVDPRHFVPGPKLKAKWVVVGVRTRCEWQSLDDTTCA